MTGGSNSHSTVAEEANAFSTDFVSAGVVGTIGVNAGSGGTGSFCVNADASPDMGVTIKAGQGYVTATPSGQNSQVLRVRAAADYTAYTINANASGSTKYDWIYLTISATNANTPSADASNVASFVTSRSSSNTTDNGSPPTYGLVLAVITVANAASSITNGNIQDKRVGSSLTTATASSSTGWNALGQVPTTVTALGNRSYSMVYNAIDITGTVSAGMRLKTSRTVPAPTQCTSLNGTTQYYSKASPAGMTFTVTCTTMGARKLNAYSAQWFGGRTTGTNGFRYGVNASGQLIFEVQPGNATTKTVTSYQSVPLNKWFRFAFQIDLAGTCQIMLDGVAIPSTTAGTATSLTQAVADWQLGAAGGIGFTNGKMAQDAIFSAKLADATVLSYEGQSFAGTETSLISAYSFNGAITDLNANANNLTANGSAVATNADSPFGGQADGTISSTLDYAIITKTAFSTNTTLTVQVPEGCTIPTSGGVSAVSYATVGVPYGFPKQREKWTISVIVLSQTNTSGTSTGTVYNPGGLNINIPIGEWSAKMEILVIAVSSTSTIDSYCSLSTSSTTWQSNRFDSRILIKQSNSANAQIVSHSKSDSISAAAATPYYVLLLNGEAFTAMGVRGNISTGIEESSITAECSYL